MTLEGDNNAGGFEYRGHVIRRWNNETLSLTDMWRAAAGSEEARQSAEWRARRPTDWLRSADAKRFIASLAEVLMVVDSHHELHQVVRDGGDADTRAHWQIGLAYAKYLSPEFHMWCNTVVRDFMEGRISLPAQPDQVGAMMQVLRDPGKALALIQDCFTRLQAADARAEQVTIQRDEATARATVLATAHERFASHEGSFTVTVAAKTLKIPPRKLFAWLASRGWIYKPGPKSSWVAYQDKIRSEVVVHATHEIKIDGNTEEVSQVRITTKGLDKIAIAMELPRPVPPAPESNILDLRGGGRRAS